MSVRPYPLRIAHVIDGLGVGGAERVLIGNLSGMDVARFSHTVYYLYPHDDLAPQVAALGISVVPLGIRSTRGLALAGVRLWRHLRANPVDIIHTHLFSADVCGRMAARAAGAPAIFTTFHAPVFEPAGPIRFSRPRYWLQWLSFRLSGAQPIAVSEYVRRSVERYLGARDVALIPNSVDLDVWRPIDAAERAVGRRELGLATDDFVFACVGRLHPEKGQAVLLQALAHLADVRPNLRVLLLGDGPDRGRLERLAAQLHLTHRVRFLGLQTEPRSAMAACDALVVPSLFEGFGLVLAEGMAIGLPSIASHVGGMPELAEQERSALLVPPADPGALAQAMRRLACERDLCARLSTAAAEQVRRLLCRRRNIHLLEQLYATAWGAHPGAAA